MKKYTIIYSELVSCNSSHPIYITKWVHVETDNIIELLKDYDAYFVFEGHCKLAMD